MVVHRKTDDVALSPRPQDWSSYVDDGLVASADFMQDVEKLPVQQRQGKDTINSTGSSRE